MPGAAEESGEYDRELDGGFSTATVEKQGRAFVD